MERGIKTLKEKEEEEKNQKLRISTFNPKQDSYKGHSKLKKLLNK